MGGYRNKMELVCWSNELAIWFIEKKATKGRMDCKKEMHVAFSMQFTEALRWKSS